MSFHNRTRKGAVMFGEICEYNPKAYVPISQPDRGKPRMRMAHPDSAFVHHRDTHSSGEVIKCSQEFYTFG
jgi:hypothetical protein